MKTKPITELDFKLLMQIAGYPKGQIDEAWDNLGMEAGLAEIQPEPFEPDENQPKE